MPESLVFSCTKILFLVSLLFVAVKDQSLTHFLNFQFLVLISQAAHLSIFSELAYSPTFYPSNMYDITCYTSTTGTSLYGKLISVEWQI